MELPGSIVDLLRDESYVVRGRGLVEEQLARFESEPPSGRVTPATVDPAVGWQRMGMVPPEPVTPGDDEQGWHDRLIRLERLESWLQRRIRTELAAHLEATEHEFQRLGRIQRLLNEWEFCVRRLLREAVVSFLKEVTGLRERVESPAAGVQSCAGAMARLRDAGVRLEQRDGQLAQISAAISGYAQGMAAGRVSLPGLPSFRRVLWIDWLSVKAIGDIGEELRSVEASMQAFVDRGLDDALNRAQGSRTTCVRLQEERLHAVWVEGRAAVTALDFPLTLLDAVLAGLTQRHGPAMAAHAAERTRDPFLSRHL